MKVATLAALVCAAFLLALAGTASANTFNVTTAADNSGTCDPGNCSLREAIDAAQLNPGDDTVNVPAGHYVLTNGELFYDAIGDTLNVIGQSARDHPLREAGGQAEAPGGAAVHRLTRESNPILVSPGDT